MFEIYSERIRVEYRVFSNGAEDLRAYYYEIIDVIDDISSLSGMGDVCAALEAIKSEVLAEEDLMYDLTDAIIRITDMYEETEGLIIDNMDIH